MALDLRRLGAPPRRGDRDGEDRRHDKEREDRVDLDPQVHHGQLHADEDEDHREAQLQVAEPVLQVGEQEVERPQAQDRERVRGVDDERVGGDREDRRDGVDREDQVGDLDRDQDEQQRRRHALRVDAVKNRWPS